MKTISKNLLIIAIMFSLLPVSVFAREDESERGGRSEREKKGLFERRSGDDRNEDKDDDKGGREDRSRGVDFCKNIDAIAAKITSDMGEKESRFDGRKEDRLSKLSVSRENRDGKREDKRDGRDEKHNTRIDALMAKADTDAERAAVNEFSATLESATKARREAVDAAVKKFREGVDKLINDKFTTLGGDIEAFKKAMEQAIAQAKADCAVDKDPKPAFMESVKKAREAFKTSKPEMIKDEVKNLADIRKAEVDKAVTDFKNTMKTAFEKLKTAFGGEI
jgi:hypothetical protein